MNIHKGARLTPRGRALLVSRVVDQGLRVEEAAQAALREWAYARAYKHSDQRAQAMPAWLHQYNWHRPHASLGYLPPTSRLNAVLNNVLGLHT